MADKLGVTYQAISNWERGETMPDITKLPELASLFGFSIDELLLNQKESAAVKQLIEREGGEPADVPLEDLRTIAPILTANQVDQSVKPNEKTLRTTDLNALAPHLSEAYLEELVEGFYHKNGLNELVN
ncbi:helix-turn-helix transcriptional regulator [Cytobacillus praedii]|uniref:helix-turn-helix domain-containing protein n=1 Tax=Cytobacillus praedii TaxID=1742358 RepID=UPI002E1F5D13|nr:helix-turn-helix transcriptional regulator [Cytobacillus praedii]